MSEPLKKQLWKQTVKCKIQNQAKVLERLGKYAAPMYDYLKEVKSGDVVINHKTTKFESNSQREQKIKRVPSCCYQSQNYKI